MDWRGADYKVAVICLVVFVVWISLAVDWTRWIGLLWLIYPAVVGLRHYREWQDR